MKKLFVRVLNKSAAQTFIRCGIKFTRDWKEVTVDAATAARLQAEQMLEVRDTDPNAAPAKAQELPTVKALVAEAAAALLGKSPPEPTVVEPPLAQADPAEPVQADSVPVAAPAQAEPAPVDTSVNAVVEAKPKKVSK